MSQALATGIGAIPAAAVPLIAANDQGDYATTAGLADSHYRGLADFRYFVRRFFTFSEQRIDQAGLSPTQYQAMLAIRAHAGPHPMTVSTLAQQLCIRTNSALELAQRLEAAGLVQRERPERDRRRVELSLTPHGQTALATLTAAHLGEIRDHMADVVAMVELLGRVAG